ncbi:hypothetical protein Y032_0415g1057 [Ancylostoma ceylanicum]|uniref:Uncharacterized protein n=1 Tax=Ancylostoma ceylanicum TaxID=53326 RepID=A0A016X3J3_9BILA|nr:hypothetical protein Y032_0415g1057 [Ancylostoma ceylanicum]
MVPESLAYDYTHSIIVRGSVIHECICRQSLHTLILSIAFLLPKYVDDYRIHNLNRKDSTLSTTTFSYSVCRWSKWSEWSSCDNIKKRHRNRLCIGNDGEYYLKIAFVGIIRNVRRDYRTLSMVSYVNMS